MVDAQQAAPFDHLKEAVLALVGFIFGRKTHLLISRFLSSNLRPELILDLSEPVLATCSTSSEWRPLIVSLNPNACLFWLPRILQ